MAGSVVVERRLRRSTVRNATMFRVSVQSRRKTAREDRYGGSTFDYRQLTVNYPVHSVNLSKVPPEYHHDISTASVSFEFPVLANLHKDRDVATLVQYKIRHARITWDYNSGYVHFPGICKLNNKGKSHINRYLQKTNKANAVVVPAGLSHLQGTWLEYETCKRVAARILYDFRYALIPLFGEDFVDLCLKPGEDGYNTLCDRSKPKKGSAVKVAKPEPCSNAFVPFYSEKEQTAAQALVLFSQNSYG